MTNFESKRPYVFAKIQSDLRAKICVRKIGLHVLWMLHFCHMSDKMVPLANQGGQRTDVKARSQFSGCRVKRDNSNKFRNLSKSNLAILFGWRIWVGGDGFGVGRTLRSPNKTVTPTPPSTMLKRRRRDTGSKKGFRGVRRDRHQHCHGGRGGDGFIWRGLTTPRQINQAARYAIPLYAIQTKIGKPFAMDFRLAHCKLPDDDCSGLTRRKEVRTLQHRAPARQPKLMSLRWRSTTEHKAAHRR